MVQPPLRHRLSERLLLARLQFLVLGVAQVHALQHRPQELSVHSALRIAAAAVVVVREVAAAQYLHHLALGVCVGVGGLEHV